MAVSVEIAEHPEEQTEKQELTRGSCGYGIVVKSAPAACPICRSSAWEMVQRELVRLRLLSENL